MKTQSETIGICFALLLVGALFTPHNVEARQPRARALCGVVQSIDARSHTLTFQPSKHDEPTTVVWHQDADFIRSGMPADSSALKAGLRVCVYYHLPFFGKPFATKIVWFDQN